MNALKFPFQYSLSNHVSCHVDENRYLNIEFYSLILASIIGVTFTFISLIYFEGLFFIPLAGTLTFGSVSFLKGGATHKFVRFYLAIMPVVYSNWFAAYFTDGATIPFVAVNLLNLAFYPWTTVLFDLNTERRFVIFSYLVQVLISCSFLLYAPYFIPGPNVEVGLLQFGWLAPLTILVSLFFVIAGTVCNIRVYSRK